MQDIDVLIVGAGPAGSTLSHFLLKEGIEHLLIDKSSFPRDKICGDGITVDVINVLKRINPELPQKFANTANILPSWGFSFHGPKGQDLRVDLKDQLPIAPFFTARRIDLDQFLIDELPTKEHFYSECSLLGLQRNEKGILAQLNHKGEKKEIQCKIVIGAEGEKPIVTKLLGLDHYREKEHLIAAIRIYHEGVKGFHPNNHLEFFFDKSLLPGYFWAFPLSNNEANVGLGMVSTQISKRKLNLKKMFEQVKSTNILIKPMFEEAVALESIKGWGLPTITKKRLIAGDNYALIGDAGGIIEPFTGKGIGPGMMSARIASEHIAEALKKKEYNLMSYHNHMYRYYSGEIKTGYTLQKSLKNSWVLNPVINIASWAPILKYGQDKMIRDFSKWV